MNLTNQGVYQKGVKRKRSNTPTKAQRERWERIRELGCLVQHETCAGNIEIHHCFTGAGGRKDHDKVIPLCTYHHTGKYRGIHGDMGRRQWQRVFGTEQELIDKTHELIK